MHESEKDQVSDNVPRLHAKFRILESTCPLTSPCEIAILVAIHNRHIVNNYSVKWQMDMDEFEAL